MSFPPIWTSKIETQIALSNIEADYIAMSKSMSELIGVRELLKDLFQPKKSTKSTTTDRKLRGICRFQWQSHQKSWVVT